MQEYNDGTFGEIKEGSGRMKEEDVFPVRLKAARKRLGIDQRTLANIAGLPASSVSHLETGARKPSYKSLRRLAISLAVTTDYLLGLSDQVLDLDRGNEAVQIFLLAEEVRALRREIKNETQD